MSPRAAAYWNNQFQAPGQYVGSDGDPTIPLITAAQADSLPDSTGVQLHLSSSTYQNNGPNYPALSGEVAGQRAIREALLELGVRHYRDQPFASSSESAVVADLHAHGLTMLAIAGYADGSGGTIASIMSRIASYPAGSVDTITGANEWNGTSAGGGYAGWETDDYHWQQGIWTNRAGYSVNAGSLALRKDYAKQVNTTTAGPYTGICDRGECHQYPSGWPPSHWIDTVVSQEQQYVKPVAPVDMTETGYHNGLKSTSGNFPTPEAVAGTYGARLVLEHFREPRVRRVYYYQLLDQGSDVGLTASEKHFGLCRWDSGAGTSAVAKTSPSWERKPVFTSIANLLTLAADLGAPFTTKGLRYKVTGGDSTLKQVLLEKRDGSHLLCLWRDVSIYTPKQYPAAGVNQTVANQTLTVTLGLSAQVKQFRPSTSNAAQSTVNGLIHSVTLGAEVVVLQVQ